MFFHFLNFSQCAFLGIKQSTKLQISKSTLKIDILGAIPFQEQQRTAHLDYRIVFLYLWQHKNKSRLRKFEWWGGLWGECLVDYCTFQNRNPVRVFLYHCISDGNQQFSENVGCQFHLHIMFDKAVFVSGDLFCVQRYRGSWQIIHLHIYMRP